MQDLGGCRSIVSDVAQVDKLVKLYESSDLRHKLDHKDDYIRNPQKSGYRGVHLIYTYYSPIKTEYNGLKIEVQLRSQLQHAWATAVETVGTFIHQALKSSQGEAEWLRFFAVCGTAFAFREQTTPVPDTPTDPNELIAELRSHTESLDVARRLQAYGRAIQTVELPGAANAHYFLIELDTVAERVLVRPFRFGELEEASKAYLTAEQRIASQPGTDAVLVSVDALENPRKSYPNYFADTRVFIDALQQAIK